MKDTLTGTIVTCRRSASTFYVLESCVNGCCAFSISAWNSDNPVLILSPADYCSCMFYLKPFEELDWYLVMTSSGRFGFLYKTLLEPL